VRREITRDPAPRSRSNPDEEGEQDRELTEKEKEPNEDRERRRAARRLLGEEAPDSIHRSATYQVAGSARPNRATKARCAASAATVGRFVVEIFGSVTGGDRVDRDAAPFDAKRRAPFFDREGKACACSFDASIRVRLRPEHERARDRKREIDAVRLAEKTCLIGGEIGEHPPRSRAPDRPLSPPSPPAVAIGASQPVRASGCESAMGT